MPMIAIMACTQRHQLQFTSQSSNCIKQPFLGSAVNPWEMSQAPKSLKWTKFVYVKVCLSSDAARSGHQKIPGQTHTMIPQVFQPKRDVTFAASRT